MKYVLIALFTFASIALYSQNKYNSMHSKSNYKMPMHSKKAKQENLDNTKEYNYVKADKEGAQSAANYKNSFNKADNSGADMPIIAPSNETGMASSGHYKSSFGKKSKKIKYQTPDTTQEPLVLSPDKKNLD